MSGPDDDLADADVLPRVPASASAMVWDRRDRLLVLEPTYKKGWTLPGGVMEADGETPWEACRREVREETGLELDRASLVVVDFLRPRPGRPGGLRFLFDAGVLPDRDLDRLVLQPEEIAQARRVEVAKALDLLSKPVRRRVAVAAHRRRRATPGSRGAVYLEGGRLLP